MPYTFKSVLLSAMFCLTSIVLNACSSLNIQKQEHYLPASVFRADVKNVLDDYGTPQVLNHSIFSPHFVDYLGIMSREIGPIDKQALVQAINTWNSVMPLKKTRIKYNQDHLIRLARLSNEDMPCVNYDHCTISYLDINELKKWRAMDHKKLTSYKHDTANSASDDLATLMFLFTEDLPLRKTLLRVYADPIGKKLIERCAKKGIAIQVNQLDGQHAYYQFSRKLIVIDPKVLEYEFNLRYLAHEMVHAVHDHQDNSITEEVLAELIGLEIQNRVTGIPMYTHPYVVFVQHLTHPQYGKLPHSNSITQSLRLADIMH